MHKENITLGTIKKSENTVPIDLRKEHAALRLSTSQEVQENVTKVEDLGDNVVGLI